MLKITALTAADGELCPVRQVLAPVTGKWQSLILLSLEDQSQRFSSIRRLVGDITQRVLTANLRELERDGYLTRTVKPGPPVEVHYALTPFGHDFVHHYKPLVAWAVANYDEVMRKRAEAAETEMRKHVGRPHHPLRET